MQPLRSGLRFDVRPDEGVREAGTDRENRTLRESCPAMDARFDGRQDRSGRQHQTRQGAVDAKDRRHRRRDHGAGRMDDHTGERRKQPVCE